MEKLGLAAEQEYEGKKLRTIGIFSKNRLEWVLTDMACWMTSTTSVPFFEALGEDGICHVADEAQFTTIFLSIDGIWKIADLKKKGKLPTLKNIVCFDEIPEEIKEKTDLNYICFKEIIEMGKKETDVPLKDCQEDDIFTLCYTSGSSGIPKGAIVLHGPFKDACLSFGQHLQRNNAGPGTTLISYLSLAHMYERCIIWIIIMFGFREGFYHGVISELRDDIAACKPNFFTGVPRIYCRFYEQMMKNINSLKGFKGQLVQAALKAKMAHYKLTGSVKHPIYDKLVFNKFRESFGGNLDIILSGSAPLDGVVADRLKILLSAYIIHGYGQTETNSPISLSYIDDTDSFSTGPPVAGFAVKVVDIPEMGYLSTDTINGISTPRGELCARGPVIPGYFKDPERTAELFDADGWLHTGDVALITPNGCLKIIDRKKNIFKLQQGEYVAPEKIENIINNSPWVNQMFVYGNSYQNYIVAIVVPLEHMVMKWAKDNNVKGSFEELCRNKQLNRVILKNLTDLSRENKLVGFEIVKKIHLMAEPMTVESGALTPTMKLKRPVIAKMYEDIFNRLYELPLVSN
eukprot:TRINITY_DN610_c0_g5_i4.p1 TRINITY_DN610_c0_g5~~TRINITY_DN610_c0_g5_i4.p1  ORF type:complete len:575 (+),score=149.75 TRINITY_DN610_c0_g5_i4:484-2208(+)